MSKSSRDRPEPQETLQGMLCSLAGLVFLVIAGFCYASHVAFLERAERAEGVVVKLNAGAAHPEIEFTSRAGARVSYPQGGFHGSYEVGERVHDLYDPASPGNTATTDYFGAQWSGVIITLALATGFLAQGLYKIYWVRAARRRGPAPAR
ncbi:DUF3592 domain-containing protein [Pseudomonas sp. RIT-PI-AD]|uniref:DUF3592 domain-containing protein n=1 Tax=Pseudomonas sp. RIT-PI-AD TaxID=3035294 RepID=UPI0021D7D8E6|nr:DUF3592 domain-containing protein [Pseudomonas sp. RIT-PI-AD]